MCERVVCGNCGKTTFFYGYNPHGHVSLQPIFRNPWSRVSVLGFVLLIYVSVSFYLKRNPPNHYECKARTYVLSRKGLIEPCVVGTDGRPQPIEHVQQLLEGQNLTEK